MLLSVSLLLATSCNNHFAVFTIRYVKIEELPSPFFQLEILEILTTISFNSYKQPIISNVGDEILFIYFFSKYSFFQNCRVLTSYYFIYSRAQSRNKTVETPVIHTPLSTTTPMSIPRSDNPGKNTARQWQYPNPRGVPDRGPLVGPMEGDLPMGLPVGPPEEFQYHKMVH